jgi:Rrf2 family protein
LNITYKGDYALKALIDIGINEKNGPVSLRDISERNDIPLKFLEQIFIGLKREGLVRSKRGKEGGYFLANSPDKITIGKIIRASEGTLRPITCIKPDLSKDFPGEEHSKCDFQGICAMKKLWERVYSAISGILDATTLLDLIEETEELKKDFHYYHI